MCVCGWKSNTQYVDCREGGQKKAKRNFCRESSIMIFDRSMDGDMPIGSESSS